MLGLLLDALAGWLQLADSITEPDVAEGVRKFTEAIGVSAEAFANIVSFAISQPEDYEYQRFRGCIQSCSGAILLEHASP